MSRTTLTNRIDQFLSAYYFSRAKRGVLYLFLWLLGLVLALSFAEYWGRFESNVRQGLFVLSCLFIASLFVRFVLLPLLSMWRWRKRMDYKEAARIIGRVLPEVSDLLLNALELGDLPGADRRLIEASIEQRTAALEKSDFRDAIPKSELRKLLRLASLAFVVFVLVSVIAPSLILDPTMRVLQYDKSRNDFSPYTFKLPNDTSVSYGGSIPIKIRVDGDELPRDVFLSVNGRKIRLDRRENGWFTTTLRGLKEDATIYAECNGYESSAIRIDVADEASWGAVEQRIDYPKYTNVEAVSYSTLRDINVPRGTIIQWSIRPSSGVVNTGESEKIEQLDVVANNDTIIDFRLLDNLGKEVERQRVVIGVTHDMDPGLFVEREPNVEDVWIFKVESDDDYGLSEVALIIEGGTYERRVLSRGVLSYEDIVTYDWKDKELEKGKSYSLRFMARDNRVGMSGGTVYSRSWSYYEPTVDEIADELQEQNEEIIEKLQELSMESSKIEQELNDLLDKMKQEGELSWSDKERLESLIEQQESLHNERMKLSESLCEKSANQKKIDKDNTKQEEFNKLVEDSISEEELAKLEELKELMEKLDKKELSKKLEEWKKEQEASNDDLDRQLELYKRLALEEDIQKAIDELKKLAEEQMNLAEEKESDSEDQNELNKEFEELSEKLDELKDRDQELSDPMNMDMQEESQQEVSEEQKKASESLEKKKQGQANESQQKAGEKMEEMAQKMEQELQENSMEQAEEDLAALRQIRENLVRYSFEEERLIAEMNETAISDPHYLELIRNQRSLNDDFKTIDDSLHALSQRVMQLQKDINRHVSEIKYYGSRTIEDYVDSKVNEGLVGQQTMMMHANDLALLLDDVQRQMENAMNQMKGMGQCNKPGQGKPSMGDIKKMQKQLSENMRKMQEMLEQEGNKPGKGKGEGQGEGKGNMSKEMAKAAAEQEALRQQIREMLDEQAGQGAGSSKLLKELEQMMDDNQKDMLYRDLDADFIERQKEIESKLLEAEQAMREEEMEERRESKSSDRKDDNASPELELYLREKYGESERIRKSRIGLEEYYRLRNRQYQR